MLMKLYVGVCINLGLILCVFGWITRQRALFRYGVISFAAAFVPAIFVGLLYEAGVSLQATIVENPLPVILIAAVISVGAYLLLESRKRPHDGPPLRVRMKKRVTHRRDDELASLLEALRRDE
jgi:hypothetical protein